MTRKMQEIKIEGGLTVAQVAEWAGVTRSAVYQAINRKIDPLPVFMIYGNLCIATEAARLYVQTCRNGRKNIEGDIPEPKKIGRPRKQK